MTRRPAALLCIALLGVASPAGADGPRDRLSRSIDLAIRNAGLSDTRIGVRIDRIGEPRPLYRLRSGETFVPASLVKLVTSATALAVLGPDHRYRTRLVADNVHHDGVVRGDLYLAGSGDPTLSTSRLRELAGELRRAGVVQVTGDLVVDDGLFEAARKAGPRRVRIGALSLERNRVAILVLPGPEAGAKPLVTIDPLSRYVSIDNRATTGAAVAGETLSVESTTEGAEDRVIVRGTIPAGAGTRIYHRNVSDPALHAGSVARRVLEREGISIGGAVVRGEIPATEGVELVTIESEPLGVLVRAVNKRSSNFVAEQLVATLGAAREDDDGSGTHSRGLGRLRDHLLSLGVPRGSFTIVDGSGLGRGNRLSPDQVVTLLRAVADDFAAGPEMISSLGVAAVDGTVEDRLRGTGLARRVRAKTGTLYGVSTLAGYLETDGEQTIAFAIMMDGVGDHLKAARDLQDTILAIAARYDPTR